MELSPSEITALLSGKRSRGAAEQVIRRHNASGEVYIDVMDQVEFKEKNRDSTYGSFTQNLKKLGDEFAHLKCVKNGDDQLLLVNTVALADAQDSEA